MYSLLTYMFNTYTVSLYLFIFLTALFQSINRKKGQHAEKTALMLSARHARTNDYVNKRNKTIAIFGFMCFFPLMAFRSFNIGIIDRTYGASYSNDTLLYSNIFIGIANSDDPAVIFNIKHIIYSMYNKALSLFTTAPHSIVILNALILCVTVATAIYLYSPNKKMSWIYFVLLGFFFYGMNITRQMIAVFLYVNSIFLLYNKRKTLGIIIFLIACGIHLSVISGIPLMLIFLLNLDGRLIKVYKIAIIIFALSIKALISYGVSRFLADIAYGSYINPYSYYNIYATRANPEMLLLGTASIILSVFVMIYLHYNKNILTAEKLNICRACDIVFFTNAMLCLFWGNSPILLRLFYYVFGLFIIILPIFIETCFEKKSRFPMYIISIVPNLFLLGANLSRNIPYYFYWQNG